MSFVDPTETDNVHATIRKRIEEWRRWEHRYWDRSSGDIDVAQLYVAGEYIDPAVERMSWATPMSMRNR